MENNVAVRTQRGPSALGGLTAQATAPSPNGDAFTAAFAGHSRTNPFKGQWGDDSKAMFENLTRQFGDELKDAKPDNGSETPGSARRSDLATGDKVCHEIVTEQKMVNGELKDIDFVILHGRCNSHNSNGSNSSGQTNGTPITGAPPPTPNSNVALDAKLAEPEKGTQTLDYLKDSLEQLALGNYTDKVTVLGTGAQIATGLLGLDLPADMAKNDENAIDKISDIKAGILKSDDANVLENLEKTEGKGYIKIDGAEGPKTTATDIAKLGKNISDNVQAEA
jgi:hypothetical protein